MKKIIYDIIQKSLAYNDIPSLTERNNQKFRYDKRYRFANFKSIRLII